MIRRWQNVSRALAPVVGFALLTSACATGAGQVRVPDPAGQTAAARAVFVDYVQQLKPGTPIRVGLANRRTIRGTLMRATEAALVVQPRTRVPEPPLEIPLADVVSVTPETPNGGSLARAVGIGVAVGAGAALAVIAILVAIYDD